MKIKCTRYFAKDLVILTSWMPIIAFFLSLPKEHIIEVEDLKDLDKALLEEIAPGQDCKLIYNKIPGEFYCTTKFLWWDKKWCDGYLEFID